MQVTLQSPTLVAARRDKLTQAYRSSGSGSLEAFGDPIKEKMPEDRSAPLVPLIDAARSGFPRICVGDRGGGT